MSETWYRACWGNIEPFEIEKETDKQLILVGARRVNKTSGDRWYARTFDEAKAMMVAEYQKDVDFAQMRLDSLSLRLDAAKRLHE